MRKKVFNSFVLDSFEQCLSERNEEHGLLISGNIFQRKHWNILIFKVIYFEEIYVCLNIKVQRIRIEADRKCVL